MVNFINLILSSIGHMIIEEQRISFGYCCFVGGQFALDHFFTVLTNVH